MYLITLIPIYRNKFQKEKLFFRSTQFSIGHIVFVPFPDSNDKEKPALVTESIYAKNAKQFLRKSSIEIEKIKNPDSLKILEPEIIQEIIKKSLKIKKTLTFSLNEIFPLATRKELNKISKNENLDEALNSTKKIDTALINKKLKKFLPKKESSLKKNYGIKNISDLLKTPKEKTKLHSEKHYLVDEIRKYFGENSTKGKGSFSFYLGFFKKIPENIIYQFWSEVKNSRLPIQKQQKIFWWKIGQYLKNQK